jgi:prevent-host-death family protein
VIAWGDDSAGLAVSIDVSMLVSYDDHYLKGNIMQQFNIADAKTHLSDLVKRAMLGEEIVIARDNKPLAMLVPIRRPRQKRVPGSGQGQILFMAENFDAIPEGFEDYVG